MKIPTLQCSPAAQYPNGHGQQPNAVECRRPYWWHWPALRAVATFQLALCDPLWPANATDWIHDRHCEQCQKKKSKEIKLQFIFIYIYSNEKLILWSSFCTCFCFKSHRHRNGTACTVWAQSKENTDIPHSIGVFLSHFFLIMISL